MDRTRALLLLSLLLLPAISRAGAPAFFPVQGVLADAQGIPLDGAVELTFRIYAGQSASEALWTETQTVSVARGLFGAYLGKATPLPLTLFASNSDLWLGIQVTGDSEMSRINLGSTPFAAFAEYLGSNGCSPGQIMKWSGTAWACADESGGVPAGAVMTFNLPACPAGWHELTEARGRSLVGLPQGGTLSGTQGAGLSDLGLRSTSDVPAHSHQVDPPAATTSDAGSHTHGVSDPGHRHGVPTWVNNSGSVPNVLFAGANFTVNYNEQTTNSYANVSVQSGGGHSHTADASAFSSALAGVATIDLTMPYIQLLVCQKD